jgi:hypothetical protein
MKSRKQLRSVLPSPDALVTWRRQSVQAAGLACKNKTTQLAASSFLFQVIGKS